MTTVLDVRWHRSADPTYQRITARVDGHEVQFYLLRLKDEAGTGAASVARAAPGSWRVSL